MEHHLAVVTGAGRGIGRAIALGLADQGTEVVLVSRRRRDLDTVRDLIGDRAHVVTADVGSVDQVEALTKQVANIGVPDILINAAGLYGTLQRIADSDPQAWIDVQRANTIGAYLMCRTFVGGMLEQGWGRILNLSSAASLHTPGPLNSAYATSKAALNHLTRHLAAEVGGTGVTANVFHPGEVKTEMWQSIRDEVDALGPETGSNYGSWVRWVEATGGDPVHKAVDLVIRVVTDPVWTPNGEFLWIDDPLQPPVPSWTSGANPGA